jgi:nucleotide-binding universal stress UspA family protein
MYKRIVVGVAQVETAQTAARQAIDLAKKLGAELHLVTAFSGSDASPSGADRKHAEGFLESIALSAGGSIQTHALPGDPAAAILRVAGEVDADLIVVGNKGMHGASRILGSIPNSIAHKTNCSILIVSTT